MKEQFTAGGLFALIALIGGWAHVRHVNLERDYTQAITKIAQVEATYNTKVADFERSLSEIKGIVQSTQTTVADLRVIMERKVDRRK